MGDCKAYQTRTGDYVCDRCCVQWDKDDDDPPPCKPWSNDDAPKASQYTRDREMQSIKFILNSVD